MKKVIMWILIILMFFQLDKILASIYLIYKAIYDSFEPLRNGPENARFVTTLLILALLYITIFKLLQNRR